MASNIRDNPEALFRGYPYENTPSPIPLVDGCLQGIDPETGMPQRLQRRGAPGIAPPEAFGQVALRRTADGQYVA